MQPGKGRPYSHLPTAIAKRDTRLSLRREIPGDRAFLLRLYSESRAGEVQHFNWPEDQVREFLRMQFHAQATHYARAYPDADFYLLECGGEPIGRLYIHLGDSVITLIDICLLARWRGAGIGSTLLRELLAQADREHKPVALHVAHGNPAERLYRRLGFEVTGDSGAYLEMRRREPRLSQGSIRA